MSILSPIGSLLSGILGSSTVDKLPVIGPLLGQHKDEQAKQRAFQTAAQAYQTQRQNAPGQYQTMLQNQLDAFAPVQHVLTKMYGPGAYINLTAPASPTFSSSAGAQIKPGANTPAPYAGSVAGPAAMTANDILQKVGWT